MKLTNLKLSNFKGVRSLQTGLAHRTTISGQNGVGKSTVADSVRWLLFGKDSEGNADFGIKTEGAEKEDHEVEAVFDFGDRKLNLKRIYREVWTRKRGSSSDSFTGHETVYFVDEIPKKQKEFNTNITENFSTEADYLMMTDPLYFSSKMKWQDRRNLLIGLAGDMSDAELIESRIDEFNEIPIILSGRTIDDAKKVISAARKKLNEQLQEIPTRIDEANRSITEVRNDAEIRAELRGLFEAEKKVLMDIDRIKAGSNNDTLKQSVGIENQIQLLRREHQAAISQAETNRQNSIADNNRKRFPLRDKLDTARAVLLRNPDKIDKIAAQLDELRTEFIGVNNSVFDGAGICAACGQNLPQLLIEKEKSIFNRVKSERLKCIAEKGNALKAESEKLGLEVVAAEDSIRKLTAELDAIVDPDPVVRFEFIPPTELVAKLAELEKAGQCEKPDTSAKDAELKEIREKIQTANADLAKVTAAAETKKRIATLKADEKRLCAEFERTEHDLFLLDKFVSAKCTVVEESVNSMFSLARFRLFETQINGGINQCCDVLGPGMSPGSWVSFEKDLNTGGKITTGLDIIRVMQDDRGVCFPLIIDNTESVTKLPEMPNQMIVLRHDAECKELTIKNED